MASRRVKTATASETMKKKTKNCFLTLFHQRLPVQPKKITKNPQGESIFQILIYTRKKSLTKVEQFEPVLFLPKHFFPWL